MMNPTKASKILSDYARNNFNAYKTLVENGYSKKTALKNAGRTIQTANDIARKALNIETTDKKEVATSVLDIVGITKEEVLNQLKNIALNDKDFTNALKVLSVFSKELGVNINETDQNKSPQVSLTIEQATVNTAKNKGESV